MNLETFCPKCSATLHVANFTVTDSNDPKYAELNITCWACTWSTAFKIERFELEPD